MIDTDDASSAFILMAHLDLNDVHLRTLTLIFESKNNFIRQKIDELNKHVLTYVHTYIYKQIFFR